MTVSLKIKVCLLTLFLLLYSTIAYAQDNNCKAFDFNLAPNYPAGLNSNSFTAADLNGDEKIDVVTVSYESKTVSLLRGDGVGGFTPPQNFPTEMSANRVTIGDLNRDGKLDLIAASSADNKMAVLLNNGQGGFSAPTVTAFPFSVYEINDLKVADFNGDGNPDVAGVSRQNLGIFLGNGQGGLSLNTTLRWNGYNGEIAVGNFNNDNIADLAVTGEGFSTAWEFGVVLGNQNGGFILNNRYSLTGKPTGIEVGNFNGDNLTDVVISAYYPYFDSTPQLFFWSLGLETAAADCMPERKFNFL